LRPFRSSPSTQPDWHSEKSVHTGIVAIAHVGSRRTVRPVKPFNSLDPQNCLLFSQALADAIDALLDGEVPTLERAEFVNAGPCDAVFSHDNSVSVKSHPPVIVSNDAKKSQDQDDRSARPHRDGAERPATRPMRAGMGHSGPGRAQVARRRKGRP